MVGKRSPNRFTPLFRLIADPSLPNDSPGLVPGSTDLFGFGWQRLVGSDITTPPTTPPIPVGVVLSDSAPFGTTINFDPGESALGVGNFPLGYDSINAGFRFQRQLNFANFSTERSLTPIDASGTIAAGGVAQTPIAALLAEGGWWVSNTDVTTNPNEILWVRWDGVAAAVNAAGSFPMYAGDIISGMTDAAISVIAATTGHKFMAGYRA